MTPLTVEVKRDVATWLHSTWIVAIRSSASGRRGSLREAIIRRLIASEFMALDGGVPGEWELFEASIG